MDEGATRKGKKKPLDVLFVHGKAEKKDAYQVIRAREDRVEFGEMSGVKEGEPLRGEVVKLSPRKEHPQLFDVEQVAPAEPASTGPAQVASDAYRKNFDAIFGKPKKKAKKDYLN